MRLSSKRVRILSEQQGLNVVSVLRKAGVSRNAFYTLARKPSVVPRSVQAIADALRLPVSTLLEETGSPADRIRTLASEARRIARRHPGSDPDNIRHTLLLLEESPADRLRRALRRGRPFDFR
jgi:transcriptional regulator with XRE-family HTH domain